MEIKVCIHTKNKYEKFGQYVHATFTEDDLMEWAQKYIEDGYNDDIKVKSVEVESIIP